jgi:hypothetical protein
MGTVAQRSPLLGWSFEVEAVPAGDVRRQPHVPVEVLAHETIDADKSRSLRPLHCSYRTTLASCS